MASFLKDIAAPLPSHPCRSLIAAADFPLSDAPTLYRVITGRMDDSRPSYTAHDEEGNPGSSAAP